MREIFERRKSIVVYATTEPQEALTLGGNTAVLYEGKLEQFGPTIDVYQHPKTTQIAQAFSDPAMNFVDGKIDNSILYINDNTKLPLQGHLKSLPSGDYQFGMRANHLKLEQHSATDIEFQTTIDLVEISGSETFLYVTHEDRTWIVQQDGIFKYQMGEPIRVFIDPARLYAFNREGELLSSAATVSLSNNN